MLARGVLKGWKHAPDKIETAFLKRHKLVPKNWDPKAPVKMPRSRVVAKPPRRFVTD